VKAVSARISVVVPVYNVEAYLEECLESLAQQTMADLEIVMVDDGSTDESPQIAERFAARDPRFRLVQQANAGLGAARNTGALHATGEFIAFVDSDDVVPRKAYELLLGALDRTGSDFASGNVRRLTSLGTSKAGFLAQACERTRLQTHITRFPVLLVDRTAWNKLYRRSFWDRHEFRFPQGVYYEDIPVTLPAHYLSRSVDVIDEVVYLWRMREGDDLSITQRRTETKALRDRVAAVEHVSRFLAEHGLAISKALYDRSVLGHDLRYFLDVLPSADADYRRLFLDLTNEFIDRADGWALEQRLAIDRLKWQLVRRRALPELLEVLRFADEEVGEVPPVRRGRHWYGDYPYCTDERLRIPRRVCRLDDELAPVYRLSDVRWEGDVLRIEGHAYIDLIGAPTPDEQQVELVVRRRHSRRRRLRLETERVFRPDVTASAAQQVAGLDWSGFVANLDGARLKRGGRWQEGSWEIGAVIRAGGVSRTSWRAEPAQLHPAPLAELSLDDGTEVRAGLSSGGKLTVQIQRRPSAVRSYLVDEDVLELQGDVGSVVIGELALQVSRRDGEATLEYPVHVERAGGRPTFLARAPLEDLVGEPDAADEAAPLEQQADGAAWDLYLAGAEGPKRLMLDEEAPESRFAVSGREIVVHRTRNGNLSLTERSFRPVLTGVEWSPEGILRLRGAFHGPAGEYDLVLSARSRAESHRVPLRYDAEAARFTAELAPAALTSVSGTRPLAEGLWQLGVSQRGEGRRAAAGAVLGRGLLPELPASTEIALKRFHFGVVDGNSPALAVERDLAEEERGGFAQRRLRTSLYPAERNRTLRDAVVYDCFGGREYSDSPRAIHEELVRRGAPFEHLWIVRDGAFAVPETAIALRHGSREYYEAFARARYIVANDHWPSWFLRRTGQTCVQTWHGAPLKRQGHDLADRPKAVRAYRRTLGQLAENWQYVVSPAPFATPILQRAFPVGADVIETGLPRTDLLLRPDRDRLAEAAKSRLGLAGKRVVLYAPTYRDHLDYRAGPRLGQLRDSPTYRANLAPHDGYRLGQLLDVAALQRALGNDDVLMFRKHRRVVDALPADAEPFVFDVSSFPDANELLLAADVLVTDYSSAVFDFASTGRPIVFFTPDLEAYRDDIRGFSIDFESEAPGPLLRTTDEVIAALRDVDAVRAAFGNRYESFVRSYCTLDDGQASSRVVGRIFSW
jgi:CDP-glycerol glycerophosphotransferase